MKADRYASFLLRTRTENGVNMVGVGSAAEAIDRLTTLRLFGLERVTVTDRRGRVLDDAALRRLVELERQEPDRPRSDLRIPRSNARTGRHASGGPHPRARRRRSGRRAVPTPATAVTALSACASDAKLPTGPCRTDRKSAAVRAVNGAGVVTPGVEPTPSPASTAMEPPRRRTRSRTRASPMPLPPLSRPPRRRNSSRCAPCPWRRHRRRPVDPRRGADAVQRTSGGRPGHA